MAIRGPRLCDRGWMVRVHALFICWFVLSVAGDVRDANDATIQRNLLDWSAQAGKLFQMEMRELMDGHGKTDELIKAVQLPSWLILDTSNARLEGVPLPSDVGAHKLHLQTKAAPLAAQIVVEEAPPMHTFPPATQFDANCEPSDHKIIVAINLVLLPADVSARPRLMREAQRFLNVPLETLHLSAVSRDELFDASALVAGPGNVGVDHATSKDFVRLWWLLGCGQSFSPEKITFLERVEQVARDGSLASSLGYDVLGWHVTSHKVQKRRRRNLLINTLEPDMLPSATPAARVRPTSVGPTATLSRIVPTVSSPAFHSASHHHRHPHVQHHPTKSFGRPEMLQTPDRPYVHVEKPMMTATSTVRVRVEPPMPVTRPIATATPRMTTPQLRTPPPSPPPTTTPEALNTRPELRVPLPPIAVELGQVLEYMIPSQTFVDRQDGNTRKLKLRFDKLDPSRETWIYLDESSQTLYGLPINMAPENQSFILTAIDSKGAQRNAELNVSVLASRGEYNHQFIYKLNNNFDGFKKDVRQQLSLLMKIARFFGDSSPGHIHVNKFWPGSVMVAWSNRTVSRAHHHCPADLLRHLAMKMFQNGEPSAELKRLLKPEFVLEMVDVHTSQGCEGVDVLPSIGEASSSPPTESAVEDPVGAVRETSEDDTLITTIVPAALIVAALLLAALVACILYRKRRKGKLSDEDKQTFIRKGVPIIFADEMEEEAQAQAGGRRPPPEPSAKTPLLGQKPPDYLPTQEGDEDSLKYQPPQPPASSKTSGGTRPRVSSPHRVNAPYVPP